MWRQVDYCSCSGSDGSVQAAPAPAPTKIVRLRWLRLRLREAWAGAGDGGFWAGYGYFSVDTKKLRLLLPPKCVESDFSGSGYSSGRGGGWDGGVHSATVPNLDLIGNFHRRTGITGGKCAHTTFLKSGTPYWFRWTISIQPPPAGRHFWVFSLFSLATFQSTSAPNHFQKLTRLRARVYLWHVTC